VSFDPYAPYGPVVESTARFVTWNVWGRYGDDWQRRHHGIEETLVGAEPDVVCLIEAWQQGETTQPGLIARRPGLVHHCFVGGWEQEDWISGVGVVSRFRLGAEVEMIS
jgi:Endonuclease/Exonuclease/phosphatase family